MREAAILLVILTSNAKTVVTSGANKDMTTRLTA